MGRSTLEAAVDPAVQFAFEYVSTLSALLREAGHVDMALLLDSFGDLFILSTRRAAGGDGLQLLASGDSVTDYVASQLGDLAELMSRLGVEDAAVLFRLPAQMLLTTAV